MSDDKKLCCMFNNDAMQFYTTNICHEIVC